MSYQLALWPLSLCAQMVCLPTFGIPSLSPCHTVDRIDHWCEVLTQLVARVKVLLLLHFLLLRKNLFLVVDAMGVCFGVRDMDVKDAVMAALPEGIAAGIDALLRSL